MYYVYLLTNKTKTVLYTGFSGNLPERIAQHKSYAIAGFTKKYNVNILVYYEKFDDINTAKARERAIKKWKRAWKDALIAKSNPGWNEILMIE